MICVSVVSHQHGFMVADLVRKLLSFPEVHSVILTKNVPEKLDLPVSEKLILIENSETKGFGENHNFAFLECNSDYFCVINPDIYFNSNPFPSLLQTLKEKRVDLLSPMIVNKNSEYDDNIRKFPDLLSIFFRFLRISNEKLNLNQKDNFIYADWVAGMFMIFTYESFKALRGFDSKYFLYYEDVDICARFWKYGYKVAADTSIQVIHDARRANRSNPHHMLWYFQSLFRFLYKFAFRFKKLRSFDG